MPLLVVGGGGGACFDAVRGPSAVKTLAVGSKSMKKAAYGMLKSAGYTKKILYKRPRLPFVTSEPSPMGKACMLKDAKAEDGTAN